MSVDLQAQKFEIYDPLTDQQVYTVCESPELLVDHDIMMTVRLKPSLKE